jgi:hypothetical protein
MTKTILEIIETPYVSEYLLKRRLLTQYTKKKENILKNIFT